MRQTDKEPVHLRRKRLSNGNVSLYLDIYRDGVRRYEFLRLYLIPEHDRSDRDRNRETLRVANGVKARRIVEIESGAYGFGAPGTPVTLGDYLREVTARKSPQTMGIWGAVEAAVTAYDSRALERRLGDIGREWARGLYRHIDGMGVKDSTKDLYLSKVRHLFNEAVREELIPSDPTAGLAFHPDPSERMYLTVDEVRRLSATPCRYDALRRAFLFSCLTGLRYSDITALRWSDVHKGGKYTRIIFRQAKTGGQEYLDINAQAAALMGTPPEDMDRAVFAIGLCRSRMLANLDRWCRDAGLTKHITFHCGRHTFATMMLELGTDLYTVSKLLGHTNISTTQIYAKVMDRTKQAAVDRIPDIL